MSQTVQADLVRASALGDELDKPEAQTLAALSVDLLGPAGVLARGGPDSVDRGKWTRLYSFQRYSTIGGGSSEVQKNIIADRAVKLPGHSRLG